MAAGEYISMQSQREMFENQISIEREEMRVMPDVEEEELTQIFRAKGLSEADAHKIAVSLMADPKMALDTKVREELGLDPNELGSPVGRGALSRSRPSASARRSRSSRSCLAWSEQPSSPASSWRSWLSSRGGPGQHRDGQEHHLQWPASGR